MQRQQVPKRSAAITAELEAQELASDRMRQSDEDRLRWVLTFAEKNFDQLRREERIALGYDLRELLPIGWMTRRKQPSPIKDAVLRRIQATVRKNIRALLADERDYSVKLIDLQAGWVLPLGGRERIIRFSQKGSKVTQFFEVVREGTDELTMIRGIADLVVRTGSRLRLCKRPDCVKPFLAIKRQQFCTAACGQLMRNRKKQHKKRERNAMLPPRAAPRE